MHEPSEFVFGNTEAVEMELRKLGMNYDGMYKCIKRCFYDVLFLKF